MVAELCGIGDDLGIKRKSGILKTMKTGKRFLEAADYQVLPCVLPVQLRSRRQVRHLRFSLCCLGPVITQGFCLLYSGPLCSDGVRGQRPWSPWREGRLIGRME